MKIKGWEKISGYTYKGYCIVNPMHNASEDIYYATVLDLNHTIASKWDIHLSINNNTDVFIFRILDEPTKKLLAKSHLTKPNVETLQKFREQYEMLVDDILEDRQSYASKVATKINGGTTGKSGILNTVQNAGTSVTYSIAPQTTSISHQSLQSQMVQQLKELKEHIDRLNNLK